MATKTEIRKDLAGERAQLSEAVERGRRVGLAVAAAGGLATAAKIVLQLRRR